MRKPLTFALILAALMITNASVAQVPPPKPGVTWAPMPIRSEKQAAAGMKGGEGGQCLHGIARSPADDKRIYLAIDVVGVWRSNDGGASWEMCRMEGLHVLGTSSVETNPRNKDDVLVYAQAVWEQPREKEEGLYRSMDGGMTWRRVIDVRNEDKRRGQRHLIDYAADGRRVYFLAYAGEKSQGGLYVSNDAGNTFEGPISLQDTVGTEIQVDPRNPDVLYVA